MQAVYLDVDEAGSPLQAILNRQIGDKVTFVIAGVKYKGKTVGLPRSVQHG
jgi:hypothetical protein